MAKFIYRAILGLSLSVGAGIASPMVSLAEIPVNSATQSSVVSSPQPGGSYVLGAGDQIKVSIFDTPELVLEPTYTILSDGTINLPWIGEVSVQNLTLTQASEALASKYSRLIRNPIITVGLLAPRPLKLGIIGEVNRPGAYILNVFSSESSQGSLSQRNSTVSGSQWPTVSRAIQTAGGITQAANVRQIQVRRPQSSGKIETINVDLWKFLQEGDLSQDILLKDNDTVLVPIATDLDAAEAVQIAGSNFSPDAIKVNIVGEVVSPGSVAVKPNATLNQAVLAAGGLKNGRARKSDVELIRLNPNGTVTRRQIALDFSKGLNDVDNPPLRNNDVVIVNRTALASTSDFLGVLFSPFTSVFGFLSLFGLRP